MMKASIIINILNSHEIVRRQILHFKKMDLPDNIEIIFVDDGSNPPLDFPDCGLRNFTIYYTRDKRPWTQGLARNLGASKAKGEYLYMTDIDHIISKPSIESVLAFTGDKMVFTRCYGVLDEKGNLTQDMEALLKYGLDLRRTVRRGLVAGHHTNTFAIKKSIFDALGGYKEKHCIGMMHQGRRTGEDVYFAAAYDRAVNVGACRQAESGEHIFMFPIGRFHVNGDTNPGRLFHGLSYEPVKQPMLP